MNEGGARSPNTEAGAVRRVVRRTIQTVIGCLNQVKAFLSALIGLAVVLVLLEVKLQDLGIAGWILIALTALLFAAAFFGETLPALLARRRQGKLRALAVEGQPVTHEYFQLAPRQWDAANLEGFDRADKAHLEVLRWLRESSEPILYLTGRSGTGKSSLLSAYVIPALREQLYRVSTLVVRSYSDPLAELERQLHEPGTVYKRPPKDEQGANVRGLLEKAVSYLMEKDERLLIVLDQFEELLIMHGQTRQRIEPLKNLLRSLQMNAIPGLTVLLSLRSDYQGLLGELELAPLTQSVNWWTISPFTLPASREFLEASGMKFGDERMRSVLGEVAAIEETPGLIRPIVLNMMGKVLQRFAGGLPKVAVPGRLLSGYVRNSLDAHVLQDHGRSIAMSLLTDDGTKHARTVGELTAATRLDLYTVEGCLVQMSSDGLVRRLNQPAEIEQRTWEVAHDFVALLMYRILSGPPTGVWKRVRPWLLPASVLTWLIVISVIVPLEMRRMELVEIERSHDAIRAMGGVIGNHPEDGKLLVTFGTGVHPPTGTVAYVEYQSRPPFNSLALRKAAPHLERIGVVHLSFISCEMSDLSPLAVLVKLETLELIPCGKVADVSPLKNLSELKSLRLWGCDALSDISPLQGLANLKWLHIEMCHGLSDLSALHGLTSLESLDLTNCDQVSDLGALERLARLQSLKFSGCERVSDLSGLRGLVNLKTLELEGCHVSDLSPLKGMSSLEYLDVRDCDALSDLTPLRELRSLQFLQLAGCDRISDLSGLSPLSNLQWLNLSDCAGITDLSPIEGLSGLTDVCVSHSGVTAEEVARFRRARPEVRVVQDSDFGLPPEPARD